MQQPEPLVPENTPVPAANPVKPGIWGLWSTVGLSVAIFFINGLAQAVVVLLFAVMRVFDYSFSNPADIQVFMQDLITDGQMLSLAIIISAVAGIAATILFIRIRKGLSVSEYLGLKSISLQNFLYLAATYVVLLGISVALATLIKSPQEGDIISDAYRNTPWPVVFWLAIVIFAPFYEEILFRGFLFVGLKTSALGIAGTIVVTGLVFALLHSAQYGGAAIAQIFVLGIVFGVVRWKTGSLWSTILLHGLWNLGQMVLFVFFPTFGT